MPFRERIRQFLTAPTSNSRGRNDEGDVPGWVLITLMTAGLVAVLWIAAGDKLGNLLNTALDNVTPK